MAPPSRFRGFSVAFWLVMAMLLSLGLCVSLWFYAEDSAFKVLLIHERIDHDDDTHNEGRDFLATIQGLQEKARALSKALAAAGGEEAKARAAMAAALPKPKAAAGPRGVPSAYRPNLPYRAWFTPLAGGAPDVAASIREDAPGAESVAALLPPTAEACREALKLAVGEVRVSDVDPNTHLIHADAVVRRGGGEPLGTVRLTLDLGPKIRSIVNSPRTPAVILGKDGAVLAASPDLTTIQRDSLVRSAEVDKILASASTLQDPGKLVVYDVEQADEMYVLPVDIGEERAEPGRASDSMGVRRRHHRGGAPVQPGELEGLQAYLDGKEKETPGLIVSKELAEGEDQFYPYAFLRSKDPEVLEGIRSEIASKAEFADFVFPRDVVPCKKFEFRFIPLSFDPADPGRKIVMGLGLSEDEIKSDFWREFKFARNIAVGCVLGFFAVGGGAVYMFTRSLNGMTRAANQVADGHYSHPLRLGVIRWFSSEVSSFGQAFEKMRASVEARTRELDTSSRKYRDILRSAPDGIALMNAQTGEILSINRALEAMMGYSSDDVKGHCIDIFLPRDVEASGPIQLAQLIAVGRDEPERVFGKSHRFTGQHKDGTALPLEVTLGQVDLGESVDDSERWLYTVFIRDITERATILKNLQRSEERQRRLVGELDRRVQERTAELERSAQELSAARDAIRDAMDFQVRFFEQVAHDLRTPLAIVIAYGEDLTYREAIQNDPDVKADVELIVNHGRYLNEFIEVLLNFNKVTSGKSIKMELAEFEVESMLRERMKGVEFLASQSGNSVGYSCEPGVGNMVADEVCVWRVLMNLLSNACKFTNQGTIHLSAGRESSEAGDEIVFRVSDTGRGMDEAELKRLFNRFEQVHSYRADKGFGLGLMTCDLYSKAMGGRIGVESEKGRGTTFTVRLPAVVRGEEASAARPSEPRVMSRPTCDGDRELILIIDDDANLSESMRRSLQEQGYRTRVALDGQDGIALARELRPAAILLDVVMPGVDGWTVLETLKADDETANIPIIMVTMMDDRARGFAMGADDYAVKPLGRDRLAQLLRKHVPAPRAARVLVVDDSPAQRDHLGKMLREHGYEVSEAADGKQAIEELGKGRPDLILLDLLMPELNGFDVVQRVRTTPEWQDIPIIVVTGIEISAESREELRGNVSQILRRDVSRPELFREICAVLEEVRGQAVASEVAV